MEIRQLQYFIAVCTHRSMSRAADALFISQQALSKVISNFEKEAGVRLFTRCPRGVEMTAEAEEILPLAKKVVKAADELDKQFAGMASGGPSVVKFGYITGSFNKHSMVSTKTLKEMEKVMPDIRLQIRECNPDDMLQMLLDGELDIGYSVLRPQNDSIAAKMIAKEPACLILNRSNPVAQLPSVTFEDIRNLQILTPSEGPLPEKLLQKAFKKAGYLPQIRQFYGTFMQSIERIRLDEGYLFAGSSFCESINREELAIRPFPDEDEVFTHYILYHKNKRIPAPVGKVIRYLEQHCCL